MIEKDKYIALIANSSSIQNSKSPIELVTDIKEIEDYEAQTKQMIGMIDNSPFYKFRMDLYKVKNSSKKFRYCNVEYDKIGAVSLVIIHIQKGNSKGEYLLLQNSFRVFADHGKFVYEIPRGFADNNDATSYVTMSRELFEETSIDLEKIEHKVCRLGEIYPDTGLTNNKVDLYRVDISMDFEPVLKNNDEKELISKYKLIPVSEIHSFISQIKDGFTLCALAKNFI